ncbi:MAG: hypothetical protein WD036_01950 [Bauldia sp.]
MALPAGRLDQSDGPSDRVPPFICRMVTMDPRAILKSTHFFSDVTKATGASLRA